MFDGCAVYRKLCDFLVTQSQYLLHCPSLLSQLDVHM